MTPSASPWDQTPERTRPFLFRTSPSPSKLESSSKLLMKCLPFLFLLACGSDPSIQHTHDFVREYSNNAAIFDPSTGDIPLPNILATSTAVDPLTGKSTTTAPISRLPNKPMSPSEAMAYINYRELSGSHAVSGLNSPIYIRFTSPLDPSTVSAENIKVFLLTPDPAGTENAPLGFSDVSGAFSYQYAVGSRDLFLFPNFPLQPGTRYLYLVTNRVRDSVSGKRVTDSLAFYGLKSTAPLTGTLAQLEPIRANVLVGNQIRLSGYAKLMDDLIGASSTTTVMSRDEISLLGRFNTTGAGFVLPNPASPATLLPVETSLRQFAAGQSLGGLPGKTWDNSVNIMTAFVKDTENPPDNYWRMLTANMAAKAPASVGAVVLGKFNSAELSIDPVIALNNPTTMNLTGVTMGGAPAYNPFAGVAQVFRETSGVITGYYHTDRALDFVYIAPDNPAPIGGYPLVVYQHGITVQKETVIALAQTLTAMGRAVIAIDHPFHGQNAIPGHTTGDQWSQDFMALGAPLAGRTNMYQAIFSLNRLEFVVLSGGLEAGLAGIGLSHKAPNRTTVRPRFVGHSLGGIVGAGYLASNTTISSTGAPYSQTTLDSDMKGFLSVPGGKITYALKDSPAFGPFMDAGLAAVGITKNSPAYHQFLLMTQAILDPADPATMTNPLAIGLPSRLSGRIAIQEATTTAFANGIPTNGDLTITNPYTRYFGNALGGRGVMGSAAALVAPKFNQLAYTAGGTPSHPSGVPMTFMYNGMPPQPKQIPAAVSALATGPSEGYFQFDQDNINHAFLLDPTRPFNAALAQKQMMYFLGANGGYGIVGTTLVVDPTQQAPFLPIIDPVNLQGLSLENHPTRPIKILNH